MHFSQLYSNTLLLKLSIPLSLSLTPLRFLVKKEL